jgi:hypothetical protein
VQGSFWFHIAKQHNGQRIETTNRVENVTVLPVRVAAKQNGIFHDLAFSLVI